MYIIICDHVKQISSPGLMQETRCLGPVPWDDPEGWDGEYMYTHGLFMSMYGKIHYNSAKLLASN